MSITVGISALTFRLLQTPAILGPNSTAVKGVAITLSRFPPAQLLNEARDHATSLVVEITNGRFVPKTEQAIGVRHPFSNS